MSAESFYPVAGVRLGVAQAGIKKPNKDDVTLIELAAGSTTAGVFTQNAFCAAPVHVAKEHLEKCGHQPRYWVINTGNANAGTGSAGMAASRMTCTAVAEACGQSSEDVLPFSTGVIGELLPAQKIADAVSDAKAELSEDGWQRAASAILTTDTRPKLASRRIQLDGKWVTITGMSKGAGMICPNMATMLAFIATDAAIEPPVLNALLKDAVDASFNRITVDGDTSTNDAAVIAATGMSGVSIAAVTADGASDAAIDTNTETEAEIDSDAGIGRDGSTYSVFNEALTDLCIELAQAIVRDGEGATKFVEVSVIGGRDSAECDAVAYTIAHSPLVKTALFASDPNWGRLLAAIGRAGLEGLVVDDVALFLNDVLIAENGARAESYTEEAGAAAMQASELLIRVELNRGKAATAIWTTDLSYNYVKINAEYRT